MATPASPAQQAQMQATLAQQAPTAVPLDATLKAAAMFALDKDLPIMLDYYRPSMAGTAYLALDEVNVNDQVLMKSKEEFTSQIKKKLKANDKDMIVITENSLYIISMAIQKRKVKLQALQDAYDTL